MAELRIQGAAAAASFKSLEAKLADRKKLAEELRRAQREEFVPPLEAEQVAFVQKYFAPIGNIIPFILGDVQSFLAAVGVVESILWPSEKRHKGESKEMVLSRIERGRQLRQLLDVQAESILKTRTGREEDARGGLLHFDEMIDDAIDREKGTSLLTFEIGSEAERTAVKREDAVRWLDEDSLDLWVAGRSANLRRVREELQRVVGRLQSNAQIQLIRSSTDRGKLTSFGTGFLSDIR